MSIVIVEAQKQKEKFVENKISHTDHSGSTRRDYLPDFSKKKNKL